MLGVPVHQEGVRREDPEEARNLQVFEEHLTREEPEAVARLAPLSEYYVYLRGQDAPDDPARVHRSGRGAMAEVYLAEQISLRRQVAFKVLKASRSQDETAVKRFHHEAQAMASATVLGMPSRSPSVAMREARTTQRARA